VAVLLHYLAVSTRRSSDLARIADALVEARLAACVQLLPGATSVYRWQGKLERASETLLLVKTTQNRCQALIARIVQLHPHDIPRSEEHTSELQSRENLVCR